MHYSNTSTTTTSARSAVGGPPACAPVRPPSDEVAGGLRFVWLEVTGSCQLVCGHCYADSGPDGTHGQMSTDDWLEDGRKEFNREAPILLT